MDSFRKKMREKIKLYSNKEYLDGYMKKEFITEDGNANIFLKIDSIDELIDKRTIENQIDLNNDIYNFIEDKSAMLDNDIPINLHITGIELSPKDQGIIKHILKEHYAIELYKTQKKYNKYKGKMISLLISGIFFVMLYYVLFYSEHFNFLTEIVAFVFSFSIWEAFDSAIFAFTDLSNEREAVTQNLLINLYFD